MSKENKKQRHQSKRDAKRKAARKRDSISPLKQLANAKGIVECWMSENFGLNGQMQLFVYKQAGRQNGIAAFLIDRGVVGLKDAWTQMRAGREALNHMLDMSDRQGIPMRRATLDEVRQWVMRGARWAQDNGMLLPKDWTKTASLIGGVDDWGVADVSHFVKEFAGHPEDLRQRLIGEPFETYVQRTDIQFMFSDEAPYMDQGTGFYSQPADPFMLGDDEFEEGDDSFLDDIPIEELNAMLERLVPAAMGLTTNTIAWLKKRDMSPSSELFEAWRSMMVAAMLSKLAMPDAAEDEVADFGYELLQDLAGRIEVAHLENYQQAIGQALNYLQIDPKVMEKAVLEHGLANEQEKP